MAANTDDMLRQLVDAIDRMRYSSSVFEDSANRGAAAARKQAFSSNSLAVELEKIKDRFGPLRSASEILRDEFNELRKTAREDTNRIQFAASMRAIDDAQVKIAKSVFKDSLFNLSNVGASLENTFEALKSTTGNLFRGFQQNADAFSLAGSVFSSGLGLLNRGVSRAADALTALGTAALFVPNPLTRVLGGSAIIFGKTIDAARETTHVIFDLLQKEIEKTITNFATLTSAGALYADGLSGMRKAATDSSITLSQFSTIIKASSGFLSELGLGIAPAAARISRVFQNGGDSFKTQLMKLGFSIEEQGVLVAEVMRDMRQSGDALGADAPTIQRETERYAQNLRVLSAITGEDGKKRMDQARQAASALAFQQKLAGMDEVQRKNVIEAMANMSDIQRKNFMDTVLFGTVINREGAVAASLSRNVTDSVRAMSESFNEGTLSAESVRKIQSQYNEDIRRDLLGNKEIALAAYAGAGGIIQQVVSALTDELEIRKKFTPEAIKAAEEAAKKQKETNDALTTSFASAQLGALKLAIAFEAMASLLLPSYAKLTDKTIIAIKDTIGSVADMFGAKDIANILKGELDKVLTPLQMTSLSNDENINKLIDQLKDRVPKDGIEGNEAKGALETLRQQLRTNKTVPGQQQRLLNEFMEKYINTKTSDAGTLTNPLAVTVVSIAPGAIGIPTSSAATTGSINPVRALAATNPNASAASDITGTIISQSEAQYKVYEAITAQTNQVKRLIDVNNQMLATLVDSHRVSREILNNTYT